MSTQSQLGNNNSAITTHVNYDSAIMTHAITTHEKILFELEVLLKLEQS
jgi:hypothetical protein